MITLVMTNKPWIPPKVLGKMIFFCRNMLGHGSAITSRTVQYNLFPRFFLRLCSRKITFCSKKSCSNTTRVNISQHFSAFNKQDFVSKVTCKVHLAMLRTLCAASGVLALSCWCWPFLSYRQGSPSGSTDAIMMHHTTHECYFSLACTGTLQMTLIFLVQL